MNDPCLSCLVCGDARLTVLYPVTDTNQHVPGRWEILACEGCGTGVLKPFPRQEEIAGFYRNQFYTPEGKRFQGWVESLRALSGHLRGRLLNRLSPKRGRLLDFGSGAGHFAAAMRKAGWEALAVDPYSAASPSAGQATLSEDGFTLLFPDRHFDAVTLWYVIEHLRDPRAAIAEFHRVLKPGGMLVLAQQDFASLQARLFGPRWLFLDPPRHLWQFTPPSLARLAAEQGFDVVRTSWASLEMGPFCLLQSALNSLLGNRNDLFRYLKHRGLPQTEEDRPRAWAVGISLALLPLLAPLTLLAYGLLLGAHSGDVFTLYLRKRPSE